MQSEAGAHTPVSSPSFLAVALSASPAAWRRCRRPRSPSRRQAWSPGWSHSEGAWPVRRWWSGRPFDRQESSTWQPSPEGATGKSDQDKNGLKCLLQSPKICDFYVWCVIRSLNTDKLFGTRQTHSAFNSKPLNSTGSKTRSSTLFCGFSPFHVFAQLFLTLACASENASSPQGRCFSKSRSQRHRCELCTAACADTWCGRRSARWCSGPTECRRCSGFLPQCPSPRSLWDSLLIDQSGGKRSKRIR